MSSLLAFEAAARHSSLTRAATELNLTQGAVSQRIKALEDLLGHQLFVRARSWRARRAGAGKARKHAETI